MRCSAATAALGELSGEDREGVARLGLRGVVAGEQTKEEAVGRKTARRTITTPRMGLKGHALPRSCSIIVVLLRRRASATDLKPSDQRPADGAKTSGASAGKCIRSRISAGPGPTGREVRSRRGVEANREWSKGGRKLGET